jgi:hypothetical protein
MLKKLSTFLFLSMFVIMGVSKAQTPPPPTLGPDEHYTNLWSVSYDYQSNGSVRYLVQDPANPLNYCSILMAQQDSTTAAGTGRYIYYSYTDDGGTTWTSDVITTVAAHGFPCLTLSSGLPVFVCHQSGTVGTRVWKDVIFGGFSLSEITGIQPISGANQPIWPHAAGTTNGNIVIAAAPNDGATFFSQRATYNGGSWSPYTEGSQIGGPSGNFDVSSGPNGKVALIGYDYVNGVNLTYFLSNDNGGTWDAPVVLAPYILEGSDTLFFNLAGGYQSIFDAAGNLHIVCTAYGVTTATFTNANTVEYIKPRIYHWSQATGFNIVAGKANIPSLSDTITQALTAPLSQPTISILSDGKLVCAYTAYTWGNTQVVENGDVVNAGEIYYSASANNGSTWSTNPTNLTNTPSVEEKYASLAPTYSSPDGIQIYYTRDLKAGGWVNVAAWGKAPVYGITRKFTPVGIRENVSIAKSYELFQNYPNPFNPTTTISYYIQKSGMVSLKVFDMLGKEVSTLVNETQSQGPKEISFNASHLSSGIYYYTITTGDFTDTKKMMLIK